MLVSELSGDFLDLGHAQFALGIALAFRGEREASNAVISFCGTYSDGEKKGAALNLVIQNRKRIEKEILDSGKDLLTGLIEIMTTKPVLHRKVVKGRYSTVTDATLVELLRDKSCVDKLYTETMILLQKYRTCDLIGVYVDTEEYKHFFKTDVQKRYRLSADKIRYNDMSDGILDELRSDFKKFVFHNSCNNAYYPGTGTPAAFLRTAFSFYVRGDSITSILNTKGTNQDLGGDSDMSLIDFYSLTPKNDKSSFDFMDAANKINRASRLLFTHNGLDTAFFDIMSCYRDDLIKKRMSADKRTFQKFLQGCSITFEDSAAILDCGHLNTIANKKSSRVALCKVFSPIIENGLRQEELYDYYEKAMLVTKNTEHHDGRRLFTYVDPQTGVSGAFTNHAENNSEMFQIIVNGHLALHDVIQYLRVTDTAVNIYNFPTIIFRNSDYLRRFQTLEEYVHYIKDVAPLVEEVRNDPNRSKALYDGFYSNDNVWQFLGNNNLLHDDLFQKLISLPMSSIQNAVEASRIRSKDKEFELRFMDMLETLKVMDGLVTKYSSVQSLAENYKMTKFLDSAVHDKSFVAKSLSFKYAILLAFYRNFKYALFAEGKPFIDDNDNYLWKRENILKEMLDVSESVYNAVNKNPVFAKTYNEQAAARCRLVTYFYTFATGKQVDRVCDWKQTRELLCICEMLQTFFKELYHNGYSKVQKMVRQSLNHSFLQIACMAKNKQIFEVPRIVCDGDDLTFLFRSGGASPMYISSLRGPEESAQINTDRDALLITAINKFIAAFGDNYDAGNLGLQLLNSSISKKYETAATVKEEDMVLNEAADGALKFERQLRIDPKIRNWLYSILEFDSVGYAVLNGKRLDLYGDGTFVLHSGVLVRLSISGTRYDYGVFGEDEMARVLKVLAAEGRV